MCGSGRVGDLSKRTNSCVSPLPRTRPEKAVPASLSTTRPVVWASPGLCTARSMMVSFTRTLEIMAPPTCRSPGTDTLPRR